MAQMFCEVMVILLLIISDAQQSMRRLDCAEQCGVVLLDVLFKN
jgi:hypothetical protein